MAAASTMKIGAPLASGATLRTASTNRCRTALSFPSPLGLASILTSPSGATQSLLSAGGSVSMVTCSAERRSRTWRSVVMSGVTSTLSASSRVAGGAFAKAIERTRQAARLCGGRSVQIAGCRGEVGGRLVDRLQSLSRGRRGVDGIRIERIGKKEVGVVDDRELLVLVLGHEAFQRPHFGDLRQRLELFHHG